MQPQNHAYYAGIMLDAFWHTYFTKNYGGIINSGLAIAILAGLSSRITH